jgi:hypothetical protein
MVWGTASSDYGKESTGLTADEKIASLFQPDTLLSAQYFETLRRRTIFEPEKRLMMAILQDAINSFQDNLLTPNVKAKKLSEEAEEWIVDKNGDWIFSFEIICQTLGFNPDYVRHGLLRWKARKLAAARKAGVWERRKLAG